MGRHPSPRSRVAPQFIAAVRSSTASVRELARRAGFPSDSDLSVVLCSRTVVLSPRNVARLAMVAQLVGHVGPILLDQPDDDAFDMSNIPSGAA